MKNKNFLRNELNEDLIILDLALKRVGADLTARVKLEQETTEKKFALEQLMLE